MQLRIYTHLRCVRVASVFLRAQILRVNLHVGLHGGDVLNLNSFACTELVRCSASRREKEFNKFEQTKHGNTE